MLTETNPPMTLYPPSGFYLHVPFCRTKCPYCHFVSVQADSCRISGYFAAVRREIDTLRMTGGFQSPETIYIGGGTPSIVPERLISELLGTLVVEETSEITIEANPESLRDDWMRAVRDAGVNRISIGVQSFDDALLKHLGRIHDSAQAVSAVRRAKQAGFGNISIDLMYGIPGQNLNKMAETLNRAIGLEPSHISCYGLSIEADTDFYRKAEQDSLELPDPEETADMYERIAGTLGENGFERYEISNFAKPKFECRHNLGYWNFKPYRGFGVAAHSFDGARRFWNVDSVERYLDLISCGRDPVAGEESIDEKTRRTEHIMLSLRTSRGLEPSFIDSLKKGEAERFQNLLDTMRDAGLVEYSPSGSIVLTVRGAVLADEIISELLAVFP